MVGASGVVACALCVVSSSAMGAFEIGKVDFGLWIGQTGDPLIPIGGSIIPQSTNNPGTHNLFNQTFGGATGWGTGVIGSQDEAPLGIPGDPTPGSFAAELPAALGEFPEAGSGVDTTMFFGGAAFGSADPFGTTWIPDADAWVARIRVTSGATLSTSGSGVGIAVQAPWEGIESNLLVDETGVIGANGIGDNRVGDVDYRIEYRLIPENLFTDGSDVYDVFVVQFPTPGTAALFGVAGLGMFRRRRA